MTKRTLLRNDNEVRTISFGFENKKLNITLSQKQKYLNMPFCNDPEAFYTESIYLDENDTKLLREFLYIEMMGDKYE